MERFTFTDMGVRKLKAPPKPQRIDKISTFRGKIGLALALRLSYSGSKTWRVLYYVNGQPRTKTLGKFPKIGVSEAYELARKFDPKSAEKKAKAGSFRDVAESFVANYVSGLDRKDGTPLRTQKEIKRCLQKYVYPTFGARPFVEIRRSDVMELRDHIGKKHGPRQANVVLTILSKLMNWKALRDEDYSSPMVRGMKYESKARERKLSDDELRLVWNACEGTFGDIVKMLLLTAQRREKVGKMKWSDIRNGVWQIPQESREKSVPGALKLPQLTLDILAAREHVEGNDYVFAGRVNGQPFNSYSQGKAELAKKLPKDMPQWQLHDLRRTARSLMSRARVPPHSAERVLGHTIKGVEGTYDRHAYFDEKAHALEALATQVQRIINPRDDNVFDTHAGHKE
jgi:integrase